MTAGEVVDRIKKNLGVAWRESTYRDTFKFGGPDTQVTGIATTVFCSFEVVRRAAAAGCNMIIPHEDTYWNDRDDVAIVSDDPLYTTKVDFMRTSNIVVFRIHDHMHAQRPDFTYVGSAREIGLDPKYETAPNSHRFIVPETTLGALAANVKARSGARALRVVGDPRARVSRIQLGVVTLGINKGWIMLGHAISEEAGMLEMAQWIDGFVSEVPVQLVRAATSYRLLCGCTGASVSPSDHLIASKYINWILRMSHDEASCEKDP